jgi:hypothetical protein
MKVSGQCYKAFSAFYHNISLLLCANITQSVKYVPVMCQILDVILLSVSVPSRPHKFDVKTSWGWLPITKVTRLLLSYVYNLYIT